MRTRLWLPVSWAVLISFGLVSLLHAADDKKKKGGSSMSPPPKSSSSGGKSSGSGGKSSGSGGKSSSSGGVNKPPKSPKSSEGSHHGEPEGHYPPSGYFPPGGSGPSVIIIPDRSRSSTPDIPRAPAVTSTPQVVAGPGQGGGPKTATAPGYLSRALSRIAVGVRYGVYFKPEGGQAAAPLPRHVLASFAVMQDPAVVPPKPGQPPAAANPVQLPVELPPAGPRSIDVVFVVDATGSMGGEIRELQSSLDEIVDDFRGHGEGLDVQFGLVAFRDQGDEYVTRLYPFTDDVEKFRSTLASLRAAGGGDIPERGDQALFESMVKLNWRPERPDRARVVIFCGDAAAQATPVNVQHGGFNYATTTDWLLTTAQSNHMQIHSVACSGMSQEGLAWFRKLAEGSGGTFEDLAGSSRLREELRRRHNLYQQPITPQDLAAVQNSLPRGVRRVAVLPFKNMSDDKKTNFLSELLFNGVTGVMKNQPTLAVSSQSSVLSLLRSRDYRDKSVADAPVAQAIGKRLGADLLVTGFYFSFQDKLHLSGQAIEAATGQTVVKVEQVVESGANLFDTPTALAREILAKAGISLEPVDSASAQPTPERSLAATKYYNRALELGEHALRYHSRETIAAPLKEKALGFVNRAIEHDAEYLEAYLLKCNLLDGLNRPADVAKTLTVAVEHAQSSQVPSDEPLRLAVEARYSYVVRRDYGSAIRMYGQILEKQPTNKHALFQLANLTCGEWGCPPEHRNLTLAKQYVAKIMTLYPTSGMARYFEDAATTLVAEPSPTTG